jgi:HlyD family secretion protein
MSMESADEIRRTIGVDKAKGRGRRRLLWIGGAVIAVLVVGFFVTRGGGSRGSGYLTELVTRGSLTVTVSAVGELAPLNQIDVGTEVSGAIEEVLVDNNDQVTAGQLLARLDTDQLEAQVRRARANLLSAQARVGEAQATITEAGRTLARTEELRGRGVATQEALDNARSANDRAVAGLASAEAQVEVAEADLAAAETSLSKAEIYSPVDGVVLDRKVDPGQTVVAAMQTPVLFTLAQDLAAMELKVAIDEADIGLVREGQHAVFTVDAYPNRRFLAEITRVRFAASTTEGVVTYETLLTVDNADLALRPGMTASATITVATVDDALLIPNEALRFEPPSAGPRRGPGGPPFGPPGEVQQAPPVERPDGTGEIWVLRGGEPQSVEIQLGETDGDLTIVKGGPLQEGDQVIIDLAEAS